MMAGTHERQTGLWLPGVGGVMVGNLFERLGSVGEEVGVQEASIGIRSRGR